MLKKKSMASSVKVMKKNNTISDEKKSHENNKASLKEIGRS